MLFDAKPTSGTFWWTFGKDWVITTLDGQSSEEIAKGCQSSACLRNFTIIKVPGR
jgi:hypothetical protein